MVTTTKNVSINVNPSVAKPGDTVKLHYIFPYGDVLSLFILDKNMYTVKSYSGYFTGESINNEDYWVSFTLPQLPDGVYTFWMIDTKVSNLSATTTLTVSSNIPVTTTTNTTISIPSTPTPTYMTLTSALPSIINKCLSCNNNNNSNTTISTSTSTTAPQSKNYALLAIAIIFAGIELYLLFKD